MYYEGKHNIVSKRSTTNKPPIFVELWDWTTKKFVDRYSSVPCSTTMAFCVVYREGIKIGKNQLKTFLKQTKQRKKKHILGTIGSKEITNKMHTKARKTRNHLEHGWELESNLRSDLFDCGFIENKIGDGDTRSNHTEKLNTRRVDADSQKCIQKCQLETFCRICQDDSSVVVSNQNRCYKCGCQETI